MSTEGKRSFTDLERDLLSFLRDLEAHCAAQTGMRGVAHTAEGERLRGRMKALISKAEAQS